MDVSDYKGNSRKNSERDSEAAASGLRDKLLLERLAEGEEVERERLRAHVDEADRFLRLDEKIDYH